VVYSEDVNVVLQQAIPDASLSKVQLFFPDPWHKKRHHKRRLVSAPFVSLVGQKLKIGGQFHLATDWEPYAEHMIQVMDSSPVFKKENLDSIRFSRFSTRFERRGISLGHVITDLLYIKNT
jgi:tRNA (guanine-N7-)-methyltransferase